MRVETLYLLPDAINSIFTQKQKDVLLLIFSNIEQYSHKGKKL